MKIAILGGQQKALAASRAYRAATEVAPYERSLEAMWHAYRASKFEICGFRSGKRKGRKNAATALRFRQKR
jgi:hypothetical protein